MSGSLIDIAVSATGGDELLPWGSENLEGKSGGDGSPTLSNFSSCGESDFERYCSANSVMGTPSMCSSVGNSTDLFGVSDFGSLKNLGFGGEEFALESCDLWETSECDFRTPMNAAAVGETSTSCGDEGIGQSGVSSSRSPVLRSEFPLPAGNRNAFVLSSHDGTSPLNDNDELRLTTIGGTGDSLSSLKNDLSCGNGLPDLAVNGLPQIPISLEKDDVDPLLSREGNDCSGLVGLGVNIVPADNSQPNDSIQLMSEVIDGATFLSDAEEGTAFLSDVEEGTAFLSDAEEGTAFLSDAEEGKGDMLVGSEMELVASDKCDESDEDGSMFNCGTDKEIDIHKYNSSNSKCTGETKIDNENPLLINSAVAFGFNDWDDFEQEALDHGLNIVSLHKKPEDQTAIEGTTEDAYDMHMPAPYDKVESESVSPDFSPICFAAHSPDGKALIMQNDQEVKCLETGSFAIENFVEVGDDTNAMKISCTLTSACTSSEDNLTSKTDVLNPCSDVTPDVSSSASPKVLQERAKLVESEIFVCSRQAITLSAADLGCELPGEQLRDGKSRENCEHKAMSVMTCKKHASDLKRNLSEDRLSIPHKLEKLDMSAFYEEMVLDMEKILLNSVESRGSLLSLTADGNSFSQHQQFRDGGLTASTSGRDSTNLSNTYPQKIDWIEVIGAKQLRGDVSFADRLVGVKEYTVYKIRVWSGREQWEVEHRYRDFFHLHRQLKAIYTDRGKVLPLPWLKFERESRKLFGSASPTVVNERSFLIQDCLRSILDLQSISGIPNCVLWFLSPSKSLSSTSFSNHPGSDSMLESLGIGNVEFHRENVLMFGNTISLIVDIRPRKPIKQALEAQHYVCAGCHKYFDYRKSLMSDFVQTLGWGKPRVCDYTGQLFCISCHTNETAVLPSRVLHNWDFALYPVSQSAKAYLESIYEQPILCVTAVNPLLSSKVPALFHLINMRKKIASMVQYVRCPFRRSIQTGLGPRRYLLESSEFFALRELVDLSKGPFAALPVMMDNISRKILDHITLQCLVCCDVGIMCGSRRACEDPSSLIFPFQEDEIQRCKFCKTAFHKPCYMKLMSCPCGKPLDGRVLPVEQVKRISTNEQIVDSMIVARKPNSESVVGYFSDLFWKAKREKPGETRDRNPVILMGLMPSTSL